MSENISQFDFSKQEDQEKFDKLSQEQKDVYIENAQEEAAIGEFEELLNNGDIENAKGLLDSYKISQEKLQEAVFEEIIANLRRMKDFRIYRLIDKVKKIQKEFPLPQEKFQEAVFEGIVSSLREGWIKSVKSIQQEFPLPQEKLNSPEIQEAVFEGIVVSLEKHNIGIAKKIQKEFPLPQEKFQEAVFEGFVSNLRGNWIDYAKKIQKELPLPQEKFQEAVFEGFVSSLREGWIKSVKSIQQEFPLPQEKLNSPEIQEAVFEGIVVSLENGNIGIAKKIQKEFPLPQEKFQEAVFEGINTILHKDEYEIDNIKQILNLLGKQSLMDITEFKHIITQKIEEITQFLQSNPEIEQEKIGVFVQSCEKSLYLQIELVNEDFVDDFKKNIKKNPLLLDALMGNSRFGPRLLSAYEGFDKTSKKKIKKILEWSDQVQREYPDVEKDSFEWRQKMQEYINQYAKNPKTIEKMKQKGIDVEAWFNYDEVKELTLGTNKQEDVSIARLIERPFDRIIGDTIPRYISIIKEEIEPYKKELQEIKVEINAITGQKRIDLEQKLASMKKALEQVDNPQRQQGIKKGIENLESQLARKKEIPYLTKLYSTIDALNNVAKKAKSIKKELKEREGNPKEVIRLKKELYTEYKVLYMRFEKLREEFEKYTTQFFRSHGDAVVQSVNTQTAEMLNHLSTDNSDIRSYFEDESVEEKLKSIHPAILSLWNRNPDIDLYLGNYSPCCISIESGSGWNELELVIADYFTDSAIHVLNLTDPYTKEPFMSAWLYIGQDAKGNTALVIDNIESQAKRTDPYHDEIWNNVRDYVIKLANKIGVDKVMMGMQNNDIEPYNEDERRKDPIGVPWKIGKANGNRSNGYYLESEDEKEVWLLWEKGNK